MKAIGREVHLDVGSYFHELAHVMGQMYLAGFTPGDDVVIDAMDKRMKQDFANSKPEHLQVIYKVNNMFRPYMERISPKVDKNRVFEHVEVELKLEVQDYILHGIIDAIYREGFNKVLIVRDYKTGTSAEAHSPAKLACNPQLFFYGCLVWKIFGEIPILEIQWANSTDYKSRQPDTKMYRNFRYTPKEYELEGFWTYLQEYVNFMRTTPPIMNRTTACATCPYNEICTSELKGLSTGVIKSANFIKIERDYSFGRFTEISNKHTASDHTDREIISMSL